MNESDRVSQRVREGLAETPDIVFVKDLEGRYLMANEAAAAVVGLTPEEMVGRLDVDTIPAQLVDRQREYDREVLRRGEPITFEGPMVADGRIQTWRTTKAPLRDAEGKVIGVIGVSTNLSARQPIEDALRRSEAQLAEAQALTAVGSWHWEIPDDIRVWSDQLFRIFGMEPEEEPLTWEEFLEVVHPDDRERVQRAFDEATSSGTHYEMVHRIIRRDGQERVLACVGSVAKDLDGRPIRAIGACQDITERRREEELLGGREAQLNAAQELTGVGSWEWDLEADAVVWSDNLYRIFGVSREEFGGTYADYLAAVHPDDREARRIDIERVVATGQPDRTQHRIVRPGGEVRTLESSAQLITDSVGRRRLIGACQDVTELRQAERELTRRALLDPLTGLGNRTLAHDRLAHALQVAGRRGSMVAVLYLDIDGFKEINDADGHAAGDAVLREVGARIAHAVRESDTVARHGGDEFLIICEDIETPGEGEEIAARVRECFSEEFKVEGGRRKLSVSVGLAYSADRQPAVDELIGEADAAMYRDKAGRPQRDS